MTVVWDTIFYAIRNSIVSMEKVLLAVYVETLTGMILTEIVV